jgi:hypothetical protein
VVALEHNTRVRLRALTVVVTSGNVRSIKICKTRIQDYDFGTHSSTERSRVPIAIRNTGANRGLLSILIDASEKSILVRSIKVQCTRTSIVWDNGGQEFHGQMKTAVLIETFFLMAFNLICLFFLLYFILFTLFYINKCIKIIRN